MINNKNSVQIVPQQQKLGFIVNDKVMETYVNFSQVNEEMGSSGPFKNKAMSPYG